MTLAQFIIRWGPDASSDMLRKSARGTACGHKGMSGFCRFRPIAKGLRALCSALLSKKMRQIFRNLILIFRARIDAPASRLA